MLSPFAVAFVATLRPFEVTFTAVLMPLETALLAVPKPLLTVLAAELMPFVMLSRKLLWAGLSWVASKHTASIAKDFLCIACRHARVDFWLEKYREDGSIIKKAYGEVHALAHCFPTFRAQNQVAILV